MKFEILELITLALAIIVFITTIILHFKTRKTKASTKLKVGVICISTFLLLNRIFTNLEVILLKGLFNIFEHMSILFAALAFAYISYVHTKGVK